MLGDVLKLWLRKSDLAGIKNSAAKLNLGAQIRKEHDHAEAIFEERFCILT